ncbi:MAG: LPS export ABC transporter ATP-binding protein [Candidatus Melainabacteria bacterium RIFCSPHIGHO2_02_FULL_34_12]|nr:MAG: LPS export ABC transporter ATP-binding protein [Candidatus Melainabacteria bacterium RIFCSPHIGHO2_02_FULL_34_12]
MSLKARNLVKTYSGRTVVNNISFEVKPGEIVGLLGPNGAGKTTSFDMIVGLIKPDAGGVSLFEKDLTKIPIHERSQSGIGYLTQEPSVFRRLSVADNLRLIWDVLENIDKKEQEEQLAKLLNEFDLTDLKDHIAISLSGGERRRVEIARVLTADPKFILLDEPFTGVDPIAIQEIQKLIEDLKHKRNMGILLTDHNPRATLSITDRAYIIQDGKILLSGTAKEIAKDPIALKYYLGEDFTL